MTFEVPPTLATGDGDGLRRERVSRLEVTVFDAGNKAVSTTRLAIPGGLEGPLAPPVSLRVPPGRYVGRVVLVTSDDQRVLRVAPFTVGDERSLRVELP